MKHLIRTPVKWNNSEKLAPLQSGWCLTLSVHFQEGVESNLIHGMDFYHKEIQSFNKECYTDLGIVKVRYWMPYPALVQGARFWEPSLPTIPVILKKV